MMKKYFLMMQIGTIMFGVFFLLWSQMEYDYVFKLHQDLGSKYQNLLKEKRFTLATKADEAYQKIFNSSLGVNDLIHILQGILEKSSLSHGITLSDIKVKKQGTLPLMSNFLFALKMHGSDDRSIYHFVEEIEQFKDIFTISKSLSLTKNEKAHKPSIEGEYVFEVYIKS